MKIELTDEQARFLIRVLENNYGEEQSDFDPKNIGDRGLGSLIIGKIVGAGKLYDYYNEVCDAQFKSRPLNKKLFLGSGWYSKIDINQLHKQLAFAISELGGEQQNGGMGTEFDEESSKEAEQNIKAVLRDIVHAFGYKPSDL